MLPYELVEAVNVFAVGGVEHCIIGVDLVRGGYGGRSAFVECPKYAKHERLVLFRRHGLLVAHDLVR